MISKQDIQQLIFQNQLELNSTHSKLCIPIINRIYKKMKAGIIFTGIKVDNVLISDGHHRYIASLLANESLERFPTNLTSATMVTPWESVIFEDEDWDTPTKVNMLNQQDADYNGISLEKVLEILK
jgi:hypothetical protein